MGFVLFLLQVYLLILLARSIFSYFPVSEGTPAAKVYDVIYALTEPVLAPVRSLIGPVELGGMAIDLAPLVVMVAIIVLSRVLG